MTDLEIKSLKPRDKKYKVTDDRGLFLQINPNGSKLWRFKYRFNNKQKEYSIGPYPEISLQKARTIREDLRTKVIDGIDVALEKQQIKKQKKTEEEKKIYTFEFVSNEFLEYYQHKISDKHCEVLSRYLVNHVYATIDNKSINEVSKEDIKQIIEKMNQKKIYKTAKKVFNLLNQILRYAFTHGYCKYNVADFDESSIMVEDITKNFATLTKHEDIKKLLINIDNYNGDYPTKMALRLFPYLFVRSANLREMEWSEIDFEKEVWTIPASKMKGDVKSKQSGDDFILPLPHQAITILKEVKERFTGLKFVFPSSRGSNSTLSSATLIGAIRRMGYDSNEFTPHGFRAMFSTIAYGQMRLETNNDENYHNYPSEVIEALLAHKERNKVKSAYNRSNYNEPKKELIQWYADYLDRIKEI